MKKILLLTALLITANSKVATYASAQQDFNLLTFVERKSKGKTIGCDLTFQSTISDFHYNKGKKVFNWGAWSFAGIGFMFKVETAESDKALKHIAAGNNHLLKSDSVNYAYFESKKCKTKSERCISSIDTEIKHEKSENGGFFGIYSMNNKAFAKMLDGSHKEIIVGFNRKKDGPDVIFSIELTRQDNMEEFIEYLECSVKLAEIEIEKVKK